MKDYNSLNGIKKQLTECLYHAYKKGYDHGYKDGIKQESVIDRIRAEIDQVEINGHIRDVECFVAGLNAALQIIDKYNAESGDIDIPEDIYKKILSDKYVIYDKIYYPIKNGTPLPKDRGKTNKESIPYLMHKEMGIPISECQKAYNVAIEYLRSQGKVKAGKEYEAKVITRGKCMMCGKELDEGLFFCKECEAKAESEDKE